MTAAEAFNNPEMKVIMLLSGYVRELGEGKDYESTTYKLAETITKIFDNHHKESSKELVEACKLALHFCVRRQMPNEHELEALSVDLKKALENHLK